MNFLILKKPAFIDFNQEVYTKESSLKSRHQILYDGKDSNARLIKLKNGKWFVKYGNTMIEMKAVSCKPMRIATVEGKQGQFLETVSVKWFLQNTQMNA